MTNKLPNLSRRSFFKIAGLGAGIGLIYSYFRGIRFPVLSWESAETATSVSTPFADLTFTDLIITENHGSSHRFRAFAPEPEIKLSLKANSTVTLFVNNIANDAVLDITNNNKININESIDGINRNIIFSNQDKTNNDNQTVIVKWNLPELSEYSFAAIGDTGGDKELGWCIQRAHDLGARFLLHLGDFNYQKGDYDNAIKQFNEAPLPIYISIGNHDFKESGLIYQQFLKEIGPLNNSFAIGNTRFINIDTAASFLPYSGGLRGKLIQQLLELKETYSDTVVFTHKPIHDPLSDDLKGENGDHDIGSKGETDWLISCLKKLQANTLLSGHIHIFDRSTYQGIDNIIVGQGLGHQDLIANNNDISKIALGHVNQNGNVSYEFASLKMPMELHCHSRVRVVKDSVTDLPHALAINEIDQSCEQP